MGPSWSATYIVTLWIPNDGCMHLLLLLLKVQRARPAPAAGLLWLLLLLPAAVMVAPSESVADVVLEGDPMRGDYGGQWGL